MGEIGEREGKTQRRMVEFFLNRPGCRYLGLWKDREANSHTEWDRHTNLSRGKRTANEKRQQS